MNRANGVDVLMEHPIRFGGAARSGESDRDLVGLRVPVPYSIALDILLAHEDRDRIATYGRSKEVRNPRERLATRPLSAASNRSGLRSNNVSAIHLPVLSMNS